MGNYFRSDTLIRELKTIGHMYRVSFSHLLPTCAHNLRPQMRPEQHRAEQSRSSAEWIPQTSPAALTPTYPSRASTSVCVCWRVYMYMLYANVRSALINETRRVLRLNADKAILLNICVICPESEWGDACRESSGGKLLRSTRAPKHWSTENEKGGSPQTSPLLLLHLPSRRIRLRRDLCRRLCLCHCRCLCLCLISRHKSDVLSSPNGRHICRVGLITQSKVQFAYANVKQRNARVT